MLLFMGHEHLDLLYEAFGSLVRLHRKHHRGMTQAKLGRHVGLSRTSITNIEKGRQHVSLHQLFAIAAALKTKPDAVLPSHNTSDGASWVADLLPPGTDPEITAWASNLIPTKSTSETETS